MMIKGWAAIAVMAIGLVGCGGGGGGGSGGGDLRVSVGYGGTGMGLFVESTVQPALSGFEGHDPRCSLASGALPPGTRLHRDCSISGRPTKAGTYSFTVKVGAENVSGTVNFSGRVTVDGPMVTYVDRSFRFQPRVGERVNDEPDLGNWIPPEDEELTWTYTLAGGTLPPGLSLVAATGAVTGRPTTPGLYEASIRARLTTAHGRYALPTTDYRVAVQASSFSYTSDGGTGSTNTHLLAYVSQPFHATALTTPGSTAAGFSVASGSLAAGLRLDPATGEVQGTPTALSGSSAVVEATLTTGSAQRTVQAPIVLVVLSPVRVHYNDGAWVEVVRGAPVVARPVMEQVTPLALGTVTRSYAVGTCSLPPGVSFNAATGVVSGTPTAKGDYFCTVDVTLTHDGVSWVSEALLGMRVD